MSIVRLRAKRIVLIGTLAVALAGVSLVVGIMVGPFGTKETVSPAGRGLCRARRGEGEGGLRGVDEAARRPGRRSVRRDLPRLLEGAVRLVHHGQRHGQAEPDRRLGVGDRLRPADRRVGRLARRQQAGPGPERQAGASDAMVRVGRLIRDGDTAKLDAELGAAAFKEFHVDLVVVAPAGGDPGTTGLLFGSPSLFQRLYTSLRSPQLLMASDFAAQPGIRVERRWASVFGARTAEADDTASSSTRTSSSTSWWQRVPTLPQRDIQGEWPHLRDLPQKEVNFTIDVNFIATLPADDALFVAEFTPALAFTPGGPKFEVPVLMRKHGLIVENQDGMDDLVNKFNMRGIPHTLGLRRSLNDATIVAGEPQQRTGWSGDGAPGDGTLRDFATGAVTQHFTKTAQPRPWRRLPFAQRRRAQRHGSLPALPGPPGRNRAPSP